MSQNDVSFVPEEKMMYIMIGMAISIFSHIFCLGRCVTFSLYALGRVVRIVPILYITYCNLCIYEFE